MANLIQTELIMAYSTDQIFIDPGEDLKLIFKSEEYHYLKDR